MEDQILGTINITRTIDENGKLHTNWELTQDMTYEEAITALELTKLKLHHQMMKELNE